MHVRDLDRAIEAMAAMLTERGALLLEIADVGTAQFSPTDADGDLWAPWWYALGRVRGLSLDVADTIDDALDAAGFEIHRRDRYQPISAGRDAKLVHALGFERCAQAYATEVNARPYDIEAHRAYVKRVLDDPNVTINLFDNTLFDNTQLISRHR